MLVIFQRYAIFISESENKITFWGVGAASRPKGRI